MRRKKFFLPVLIILLLLFILGVSLFFYNDQKPVKIQAKSFTTSMDRQQVARLFSSALVSSEDTAVLGAGSPLEVKQEQTSKKTDFSFNALAPSWEVDTPEGTDFKLEVRFSDDGKNWSVWRLVEEDEDGHAKDGASTDRIYGNLIVGQGRYIQQRFVFTTDDPRKTPEVKDVKVIYIDSKEKNNLLEKILKRIKLQAKAVFAASGVPKHPTDSPEICSRACWGADESLRTWDPYYATIEKTFVHHTVTANDDPDPGATVRAIYYFHAVDRGWGDIGYNFLIDQNNGVIYEGRYGGDRVIGAHAAGYNTGSVGVGVLGDFRYVVPNKKVQNSLHKILVWKLYSHKVDPAKISAFGSPKKDLPAVNVHGDVSNTACAGTNLNSFIPTLRYWVYHMPQQIVLRNNSGTQRIEGTNDKTVADLLEEYKNYGTVSPNYVRNVSVFPDDGTTPPDDPNYSSQWDLSKLEALNVWQTTSGGSSGVVVAVLDTGVAYEDFNSPGSEEYAKAPDFASTNFVAGYDFINDDSHPNDDHGHGTLMTSIIAETTNNSLGSASLAYNVSIMPVKVCSGSGFCTDEAVVQGIDFARENGAKVMNMSFGGDFTSSTVQSALTQAWEEGLISIAASGNNGGTTVAFPARATHVLAVGATTQSDAKASYSNTGTDLDLVAPGGDGSGGGGDMLYQIVSCSSGSNCTSFSYVRAAGTSLSTAVVSATAALMVSKGLNFNDTVGRLLMFASLDLGVTGKDDQFGWGRVRPKEAFQLINSQKPHPNGSLIKTRSQPQVYLVDQGEKRLIPNTSVFFERYKSFKIVSLVTNSEMAAYTSGSNVGYPDGVLLKGSPPEVYVLSDGERRLIPNPTIFTSLGYKWENIIKISDSDLSAYPLGPQLSSVTTHPNGSLLVSSASPNVYLIDGGQKRWVPNPSIFDSRFLGKYIIKVSNQQLDSYPGGSNVTYRDGSLIKTSSAPQVYIVSTATGSSTQTKHLIYNGLTFVELHYAWENIQSTTNSVMQAFSDGYIVY